MENQIKYGRVQSRELNLRIKNLEEEGSQLNKRYKLIKEQQEKDTYNQVTDKINNLNQKLVKVQPQLQEIEQEYETLSELIQILNSPELEQKFYKNIIQPVNEYLQIFLEKLNSPYAVRMNENFEAVINERMEIDSETLSGGEDKKINIAIALSYLCLTLDKSRSNILFLDEIFESLDVGNVDTLLSTLKEISQDYQVNIIIVHHNHLNMKHFDRHLEAVREGIFSNLNDKQL